MDLNYVSTNLVDKNYTFGNVKNTFKKNVFPVSLDGIKYDGVTKPPLVTSRQSGWPRTRRINKMTKRVPGCRRFTDCLFKLWLQRS